MYYVMTDYQQVLNDREVYLTAGKLYYVITDNQQVLNDLPREVYSDIYNILDDSGYAIGVSVNRPSAHLNDIGVFKLYRLEEVTGV